MSSPSSGLKNMQSTACYLLQAGFLLGLISNPEDEDGIFLRNVD
jgi:hypothetical protein